jgi:hypothetical protein
MTNAHGAACLAEIALRKRERFANPRPCAPRHHDHTTQPYPVGAIPRGAHHGDDLLDGWRVWRVAKALIARWPAPVKARQRRGATGGDPRNPAAVLNA